MLLTLLTSILIIMMLFQNGNGESMLFSTNLLDDLDWNAGTATFKNGICPSKPGEGLQLRPLAESDYHKGYMQLLSQLTKIGKVPEEVFKSRFEDMKKCKDTYYIVVLEDIEKRQIIGSASLILEQKFIHSAGQRGRIEDVVVYEEYRGKQLGKLLVQTLTLLGKKLGCYKMSLECKEENVVFYENFDYKTDGQLFMVQRFLP